MLLKVNAENRDLNRQEHWPDVDSTPNDTYGDEGEENTGDMADAISQHSADFSSNENLGGNRDEEEEDIPIQSFGKVKGNEDMKHLASGNVFKTQSFA